MRILAALVIMAARSTPCRATSLEEAQAEAAASSRLVLVDASAAWCGPCGRFLAARESSRKLATALGRPVFVVVDDESPSGERALARLA